MKHLGLLAAAVIFIFSFQSLDCSADLLPSAVRSFGAKQPLPGERFLLVFGTPEGVHYAALKAFAPYRKTNDDLVLLRGKVWTHKSKKRPIAGSLLNHKLTLEFIGAKRRGRILQIVRENSRFRLKRASPYWVSPCGVSQAQIAAAYSAPSEHTISNARILSVPLSPTRELDLATEGDSALYQAWGTSTNSQIQSIVNTSATVYLSQVGIVLNVSDQHYFTDSDPFTSTDSSDILTTFQNYTLNNHQLSASSDAFMLFSGLDFDDSIVGLAYVGAICADGGDYSFGIVQKVNSTIQSIVFSHELGHNFGANHDNSTQSIMSPYVAAGNTEFSSQSLSEMDSHLSLFNSCLAEGNPELSLRLSTRLSASRSLQFFLTPSGVDPSNCNIKIYGATSTTALEGDSAHEITPLNLSFATGSKSSQKIRKRRKSKQVLFRAAAECDDGMHYSNVARLRDDIRSGAKLRANPYLDYLQSRF